MNFTSPTRHAVANARAKAPVDDNAAIRLPHTLPAMMKEREVCDFLSIAPGTLRNWRISGYGPQFCKLSGSVVRYPTQFLEDWLNASSRRSTSEVAR